MTGQQIDRDRLRALAENATPGPWHWDPPSDEAWPCGDESLRAGEEVVLYGWGYDASGIDGSDDTARRIAYHDSVCSPNCGDDISTYPTPPNDWSPHDLTKRIARILNDEGWTFEGIHEPGEYDECEECRLAVDPIAARIAREVAGEVWDEAASHAERKSWITNFRADDLRTANPYRETRRQR